MFEIYTQDYLLSVMLKKAKEKNFPTTEGSLIYNASCLMAVMLEDAFDKAEEDYINAYPDTCDREHLIRFARDRNLSPKSATKTEIYALYEGDMPAIGVVMTNGEVSYTVKEITYVHELTAKYTILLECNTAGVLGNKETGSLYLVDFVENFKGCEILEIVRYGTDEEDTEVFRTRYFDSFGVPGQFGNAQYWKDVALGIEGIGRVLPVKSTGSDGKVIVRLIVTGHGRAVEQEVLEELAAYCDESDKNNVVPFGQTVEVSAAKEVSISVNANLTISEDVKKEDIVAEMNKVTDEYIKELNLLFGDKTLVVRRSYLETLYNNIDGVDDCEVLSINGTAGNIILNQDEIATRGEIVC